jgi:methyl-accepting chemotaxis protein
MRFDSIRDRLIAGFSVLVLLILGGGLIARSSLATLSGAIGTSLAAVQKESQLSTRLSANIAQEIAAATHYVSQRDRTSEDRFRQLGFEAHGVTRQMSGQPNQTSQEIALIADIDRRLSDLEVGYALAHRLADLGRTDAAQSQGEATAPVVNGLLADVQQLGLLKANKVSAAAESLRRESDQRSTILVIVMLLAVGLGIFTVIMTVRWISVPLKKLLTHARLLSQGNLDARTTGNLPGEFRELAQAMNLTAEQLASVTVAATRAADEVSASAHQLSGVSEQISQSSSHMATAMGDVTTGAEGQVRELRTIEEQLFGMRGRAQGVLAGAEEVNALAGSIEQTAADKRIEIARTLQILENVRTSVQSASSEVTHLSGAVDDIAKFVTTVGKIAEQTNLLALNAAIEAARAGHAGRGFAVVADEVRKLAEQAQDAAEDVVKITQQVTKRVSSTAKMMDVGVARVGEIETVSRDIDDALTTIGNAAEKTRHAASGVTFGAMENMQAVDAAAEGVQIVARAAEQHAAAAEEVSASTEEQSAACEQMSSSSSHLLDNATRLRGLIAAMRLSSTGEFASVKASGQFPIPSRPSQS